MTDLEHLGAFFAYTYKNDGVDGLNELIDGIITVRSSTATYELFTRIINELRDTGLFSAADDLDRIALDRLPHKWELPEPQFTAPYDLKLYRQKMKTLQDEWERNSPEPRSGQ